MPLTIIILIDLAVIYFFFGNSLLKWFSTPRGRRRLTLRQYEKHLQELLARDRDILSDAYRQGLSEAIREIHEARKGGDAAREEAIFGKYSRSQVKGLPPPKRGAWMREHLEILVVALGVAFGIRSLFIQPFKIPTGSMQPTLYGIHFRSSEAPPSRNPIHRFLNYWNLSRSAVDIVAEEDGHLDWNSIRPSGGSFMFFPETEFLIGKRRYVFPATVEQTRQMLDAYLTEKAQKGPLEMVQGYPLLQYMDYAGKFQEVYVRNTGLLDWATLTDDEDEQGRPVTTFAIGEDSYRFDLPPEDVKRMVIRYHLHPEGHGYDFKAGDVVIRGYAESGDHLFVNRLGLLFNESRRGMPMVFLTTGLVSKDGRSFGGSYYIKRLVGLPGDTLKIVDRRLYVKPRGASDFTVLDGECHPGFGRIYSMKGGYRGYSHMKSNPQLGIMGMDAALLTGNADEFTVPDNHYFMMGDNSENSWDSRWFGAVPRKNLVGAPGFVWWPLSRRWGLPDRCGPDEELGETPPTISIRE